MILLPDRPILSAYSRDEAVRTGLITPDASLLHKRFVLAGLA